MTEDEIVGWHHQLKDMSLSKLWEMVKDREAWRAESMGLQRVDSLGDALMLGKTEHSKRKG